MDGIWTRFLSGPMELKVIRGDLGVVLGHFGSWEEAIDRGWQAGAQDSLHLVSDGDRAIAQGLQLVYGRQAPRQLCYFHLLQEYRRNISWEEWEEAKKLLSSQSRREGADYVKRIVAVTGGRGAYWCRNALNQGLRLLDTGQERYKTTSRLERLNRELRRQEKLGTAWSPHNLKAYANAGEARRELGAYLRFYNHRRPHQALGYRTPAGVFHGETVEEDEDLKRRRCSDQPVLVSYGIVQESHLIVS